MNRLNEMGPGEGMSMQEITNLLEVGTEMARDLFDSAISDKLNRTPNGAEGALIGIGLSTTCIGATYEAIRDEVGEKYAREYILSVMAHLHCVLLDKCKLKNKITIQFED